MHGIANDSAPRSPFGESDQMLTADTIFGRPPTPVASPPTRPLLAKAIEMLSTIEADVPADLVEQLAVAIVNREDELKAVRMVLSAALALTFTQHNEIVRLQIRDVVRRPERTGAP